MFIVSPLFCILGKQNFPIIKKNPKIKKTIRGLYVAAQTTYILFSYSS